MDPGWEIFADMVQQTVAAIRERDVDLPLVMGGLSPIDPDFLRQMEGQGGLDGIDVLAVHGFPLDWTLWPMEEWPERIGALREEFDRPVWVTETGVSSFASERIAARGLRRTREVLRGEKVYWYSLLDLDGEFDATTRHKEAEGSGYFRHFHYGLLRADGTPKAALDEFDADLGICQWFQYRDEASLELAVRWLERLDVREVRTGLSWAESHIEGAWYWFDTLMSALEPFDVCLTLCFTPPSRGMRADHTSPPRDTSEFAGFAAEVADRYVLPHVLPHRPALEQK